MDGFLAYFTEEKKKKASEKLSNLPKITQEAESEQRAAWAPLSTHLLIGHSAETGRKQGRFREVRWAREKEQAKKGLEGYAKTLALAVQTTGSTLLGEQEGCFGDASWGRQIVRRTGVSTTGRLGNSHNF